MSDRRERARVIAIVLALVSAGCLVAGAIGKRWMTDADDDSSGFGLREAEACDADRCQSITHFEIVDKMEAERKRAIAYNKNKMPKDQIALPAKPFTGWPIVGMITFVAALVAAAGLVVAVVITLLRKRPEVPIMPTTLAVLGLAIALINGCIFIATKPSGQLLVVGWSFIVFGGGIVTGLAAVFPLNRQIRPIDEELGAASATMSWGTSRDDE